MQESMIELLALEGMELQKIEILGWQEADKQEGKKEKERKKICRIVDSDRLIFLIELEDIKNEEFEYYVNGLVEWAHEHASEGADLVERYRQLSMRQILWDMYVIFVSCLSDTNTGLQEEEIYPIQRNSHFMKRYVVQGDSNEDIAKKINFIVKPEKTIDYFIDTLNFENNEVEFCREMSHTAEGEEFGFGLKGDTYQKILDTLKKVNGDTFGENKDEDTGD